MKAYITASGTHPFTEEKAVTFVLEDVERQLADINASWDDIAHLSHSVRAIDGGIRCSIAVVLKRNVVPRDSISE